MSRRERDNSADTAFLQCGDDLTDAKDNATAPGRAAKGGQRRVPALLTPERLRASALWYVERYAASRAAVRRFLQRRIRRAEASGDPRSEEAVEWIEPILDDFVRVGLIDDQTFAQALARSRLERGESGRRILARLAAKGIGPDTAKAAFDSAIAERGEIDPDRAAALRLAARKKLGPYRHAEDRARYRERDLRAMARHGFGAGIAYRIIDAPDIEEVEGD